MLTERMLRIGAARGLCACGAALILGIVPHGASAGRFDNDTANAHRNDASLVLADWTPPGLARAEVARLLADQKLDQQATGNGKDKKDENKEKGWQGFAHRKGEPLLPPRGPNEAPIPEPSSLLLFAMGLLVARQSVLRVARGGGAG